MSFWILIVLLTGIMGAILTVILASRSIALVGLIGASLGAEAVLLSIWSAVFCAIGGLIGGAAKPWKSKLVTGISPDTAE